MPSSDEESDEEGGDGGGGDRLLEGELLRGRERRALRVGTLASGAGACA